MSSGKTLKETIEEEYRKALDEMKKDYKPAPPLVLPPCHWCMGVVRQTSTKGRMECDTCGAISLEGHRYVRKDNQ